MRVLKGLGLGFLLAVTAMFGVGFFDVLLDVPSGPAGTLEGLAFAGGFALGFYLVFRGSKPKPSWINNPEEWGKQDGKQH